MKFGKNHKVIIDTLTRDEARDFLDFLLDELWRHQDCIARARKDKALRPSIALIYDSAITRHAEDVLAILRVRETVKEEFEL